MLQRIERHTCQKDFWTHAAAFTSKDFNLNRAHVQYIEARLVALASEAKRAELDNSNVPQEPSLSEADRTDAEAFLQDVLLCLPLVRANFFEKPRLDPKGKGDLFIKSKGTEARGADGIEGVYGARQIRSSQAGSTFNPRLLAPDKGCPGQARCSRR